jgi:DNA-binding transcriptional LysR family regulator
VPAWLVALRAEYAQAGRQPAEITLVAANSEAVAGTVAEHGVDLGFVEGPSAPRGLRSRVVATDRLVIVVRPDHPWARRRFPVGPGSRAGSQAAGGVGRGRPAACRPRP